MTMHIYIPAGDCPPTTSRFSDFLALYQQRQDIVRALKQLEYIVSWKKY